MKKVLGLRICSVYEVQLQSIAVAKYLKNWGRAKATSHNHWLHKLSAYIMCSYLYTSRIYCDNNLYQTQANPSHLEPSYKNQYVALSIFSNSKHTSVLSISPHQEKARVKVIGEFKYIHKDHKLKICWCSRRRENFSQMHNAIMKVLAEHLKIKFWV